jgi:hypothetical protein
MNKHDTNPDLQQNSPSRIAGRIGLGPATAER